MGRRLVVEADGGSRGNPGRAGCGAVVRDAATGEVLAQRAESIGFATNNVAEYGGLVAGLQAAADIDPGADVEVRMDSKLVVEQMSGRWQIKHEDMRRLARQAREVVRHIVDAGGSVRYEWVPRSANAAADALANAAMDGRTVPQAPTASRRVPAPQPEDERAPEPTDPRPLPRPEVAARVVLVRHGVTEFTVSGRLDGRGGPDPGLNDLGRRQAAAAGQAVKAFLDGEPARVVTSDLARAVETGSAVADTLGVRPARDGDWDEQGFGDWDGHTFGQLVARHPAEVVALRDDPDYARPGGESHNQLVARVVPAFDRVVAAGGATVVASHRKPVIVVLAHLLGIPHERVWRLATAPASLSCVEVMQDGSVSVAFVNDTAHLRGLDSPPGALRA
ncbi:MAG TPA: bifunctional RNase H/acid phosphatase [Dermatophilaceae bacterium]|nr:bifunctional RNase H/acid phosphatase [Dermatophilaceae bacterium]